MCGLAREGIRGRVTSAFDPQRTLGDPKSSIPTNAKFAEGHATTGV